MSLVKVDALELQLQPYNSTQRIYLCGIAKGMSREEAFDFLRTFGSDISRYILEPGFKELVEYLENSRDVYLKEAEELFVELLGRQFATRLLMKAIGELEKPEGKQNLTILREANKVSLREKGSKVTKEDYDEMILRRHHGKG